MARGETQKVRITQHVQDIMYKTMSGESKTVKFKQAEPLIDRGEWVLIED